VTGDGYLVFPAKLFLYSISICYWSMENHLSEVENNSNSFTYEKKNELKGLTACNIQQMLHDSVIATTDFQTCFDVT